MPTEGIKPGDTWCIPSTGENYQAEDASAYGLKFYIDSDGKLYYDMALDDGSISVEMQGYDLKISGIVLQSDENGDITTPIRWVLGELHRYVRITDRGLHVGAVGKTGEVLIDENSVDVVLNGTAYSSFAANYVEFGNYQLRKTADGGLAFKMR
jgi:hypothetical protein